MLQPVVRRTWAPQGQTPIQYSWDRRDRLSLMAAISLAPQRRRFNIYFRLYSHNIRGPDMVTFVRMLRRHVRRPIVLILDRWSVHRSKVLGEYLQRHASTIQVEWLPAYAPDLNPVEQIWNHTKYSDLANYLPADVEELAEAVTHSVQAQPKQPSLVQSYFQFAGLEL